MFFKQSLEYEADRVSAVISVKGLTRISSERFEVVFGLRVFVVFLTKIQRFS